MYDISNRSSFESIEQWSVPVRDGRAPEKVLFLVGNKADLNQQREVTYQEGQNLAIRRGMIFMETSTEMGDTSAEAFNMLARDILENPLASKCFFLWS